MDILVCPYLNGTEPEGNVNPDKVFMKKYCKYGLFIDQAPLFEGVRVNVDKILGPVVYVLTSMKILVELIYGINVK
jgi:hypothetical protein